MKSIILCADGTWNTPHGDSATTTDTNVRKIYMALANGPTQLKYYDSGVGTDGTPIDHLSGGAMGEGLFQKIQDCYSFLSDVHDPGDNIYLFGFSRGAFTARSLAGMIAAFGVPTVNLDNSTTSRIFAAYREPDADKKKALKDALAKTYGLQDVTVEMVGVWDTVGSLGIPGLLFSIFDQKKYGFLDTNLHPCLGHAYHAISIDERRAQFKPTLWTDNGNYLPNGPHVQQVWFPGVHTDVGGSEPDSQLSDITLSWMMQKAKERGLIFTDVAEGLYLNPPASNASGPTHDHWQIVPWGIPAHRAVPDTAVMSDTVQMRLSDAAIGYKPENLKLSGTTLNGYPVDSVVPYVAPIYQE